MWFFKKKSVGNQSVLTDEMRQHSLETRRMQHQINQLEKRLEMKANLNALQEMATGGNNNSQMEQMILPLVLSMFSKNQPQEQNNQFAMLGATTPQQQAPVSANFNITDTQKCDTIVDLLKNNKKAQPYMQQLNELSDGDILYIKARLKEVVV
jgi:hypothetical protein